MRKIIPPGWDISSEWDLECFISLCKSKSFMRIDSSHPGEISPQCRWDLT